MTAVDDLGLHFLQWKVCCIWRKW